MLETQDEKDKSLEMNMAFKNRLTNNGENADSNNFLKVLDHIPLLEYLNPKKINETMNNTIRSKLLEAGLDPDGATATHKDKMEAVATNIENAFIGKIKIIDGKLYVFSLLQNKGWVYLGNAPNETNLSYILMKLPVPDRTLTENQLEKKGKMLYSMSKSIIDNNIIQFDNCYIKDNKRINGFFSIEPPKNRIYRPINNSYNKNDITEILDLINHLCNDDKDSVERVLDIISLALVPDPLLRNRVASMLRFYGPSGQNGKSTLINFLINMLGKDNVVSTSFAKLAEGYNAVATVKALVAIDADASETYVDDNSSELLKKIITADRISIRQIYEKARMITPTTLLLSASNHQLKSSDKTDALTRRINQVESKGVLKRKDEWFKRLMSEKQANAFISMLWERAENIVETGEVKPLSKQMMGFVKDFESSNNNVISFIEDRGGVEGFNGYSVRYIRDEYEKWCKDNAENSLQQGKFNATIESRLGIKRKAKYRSKTKDYVLTEDIEKSTTSDTSVVKAWLKEDG